MTKYFTVVTRILMLGVLIAAMAGPVAARQHYPDRRIRMIVPFPPGGGATRIARLVAQKMDLDWGQSVVVDNMPGGNTAIGEEALVRAKPDGYTLLMQAGGHCIHPLLQKLPYNVRTDFAPVATVSSNNYILVLNPKVPANNLKQFIAMAKSEPGKLNMGTAGVGTTPDMTGRLFEMTAGVKFANIPYKGGGPALVDLLAGRTQVMFEDPANLVSRIKNGVLKGIAVSGHSRLPVLPNVPTFAQAGLPGFYVRNWFGVFAPAHTPKPIIDKISAELAKVMKMPDIRQKLTTEGIKPFYTTPEQFGAIINEDLAKWARVVKVAHIKKRSY